ncbi:hypothetical protein [Mycolicibacterium sarraceniae]|uniref:hypothetical protein n=1 Tax=Mycolicibacterium sarraceniae TaxID=1534348 RepID=UPI0013D1B738|nr:hypothetical protein [Mycolicibacterium sarraceniae]
MPAVAFTAVIWAVLVAATGVLVVFSVDDCVAVCSSAGVLSAAALFDVIVVPAVRRALTSGRCVEPRLEAVDDAAAASESDAVDGATVFFEEVDLLVVPSAAAVAAAEDGAFGPRAGLLVAFFDDPVFDVAELPEFEDELWSASSALATATTGPASDNPSASAAIPALAPR